MVPIATFPVLGEDRPENPQRLTLVMQDGAPLNALATSGRSYSLPKLDRRDIREYNSCYARLWKSELWFAVLRNGNFRIRFYSLCRNRCLGLFA